MPAWDDDWTDEPPVDSWFKVTGMLAQNWATVAEVSGLDRSQPPTARIDFFDDHGNVIDALTYPSVAPAPPDADGAEAVRRCAIACGSDDSVFARALRVFLGGKPDQLTLELL